jgi:hypothetical protein
MIGFSFGAASSSSRSSGVRGLSSAAFGADGVEIQSSVAPAAWPGVG